MRAHDGFAATSPVVGPEAPEAAFKFQAGARNCVELARRSETRPQPRKQLIPAELATC